MKPLRTQPESAGCSMVVDHIGHLAHLHARDTALALISRAPLANLEAYKQRMGVLGVLSRSADDCKDLEGLIK